MLKVITTTYCDNFTLLKEHYNFYKKKWGVDKYIAFIGKTKRTNISSILDILLLNEKTPIIEKEILFKTNIILTLKDYGEIVLVIYEDQTFSKSGRWNSFRRELEVVSNDYLSNITDNYYNQVIDNDEFYWFPDNLDIWKLLLTFKARFHYFEYIPTEKYNINDTPYFCIYSQHNRGSGFEHIACKSLCNGKMYHNNNKKISKSCEDIENGDKNYKNMFICFHFAIIDKVSFINYRLVKYMKNRDIINKNLYNKIDIPKSVFNCPTIETGKVIYEKVNNYSVSLYDVSLSYFDKIKDHSLYKGGVVKVDWLFSYIK
jgi:hypothetical protein